MKKFIYIFLLIFLAVGCSKEGQVKETAVSYIKKQLKNPESLKIVSIEVRKDTVPSYISHDILTLADKANDALDEYTRYSSYSSYLWADEKYQSSMDLLNATQELKDEIKSAKENQPATVEYVAYVKYTASNALGGTVSGNNIVIVDSKDPKTVLGSFSVDTDFIKKYIAIKMIGEGYEFKQNRFGKYDTTGLPYFEQFILNDAE